MTRRPNSHAALRPALLLAAALGLSACGTNGDTPLLGAARTIVSGVSGDGADRVSATQMRATLSRSAIDRLNRPLLLVEWERRDGAEVFLEAGQNSGIETWRSPQGLGVSLTEAGVLRSTRGYGADLMASDTGTTAAALATRRSGAAQRVMMYVDGELVERPETHRCHIRAGAAETIESYERLYSVTRMTETCQTGSRQYENTYWVESNGTIRRSRQWVSPDVGYLRIDRLS